MKNQLKISEKTKLFTMFVILSISMIYITSCSKDNSIASSIYPEENFLKEYLKNAEFNQNPTVENYIDLTEYFLDFSPTVNGQINSLVIKAPVNQSQIEVSIVDVTRNEYLLTIQVDLIAGQALTKKIDPILIEKNNVYKMVVDYKDCYEYKTTNNQEINYPVKAGNINVTKFGVRHIRSAVEYLEITKTRYAGEFSFNFQRSE